MKKIVSILLILAVIVQMTSSFWILVTFYVQREYIANTICENRFEKIPVCKGQCFLKKQLTKNDKHETKTSYKFKEVQLFFSEIELKLDKSTDLSIEPKVYYFKKLFFKSFYRNTIFHPPQFC